MKSNKKNIFTPLQKSFVTGFTGRIFKVLLGTKKLPNGRKVYFEAIDHPGASITVPFIFGKIVFIRQYRGVVGRYIWELPAGTLSRGETPNKCAEREVLEETGYKIKRLKKLGMIYTTPGYSNEKIYVYKAECIEKGQAHRDQDELIRVRLLSPSEVRRFFKNGKINDSKTIAALSFAGLLN